MGNKKKKSKKTKLGQSLIKGLKEAVEFENKHTGSDFDSLFTNDSARQELKEIFNDYERNTKAVKNDKGKPRISLIPKEALWGMAKGLTYGADKYGTHNFRSGLEYTRLADACYRHLSAFIAGEDIDVESGNTHLDHAMASLAMLAFMVEHRKEMDDRYKEENASNPK